MIHVVREYQPGQDTPSLRDCIVELQEFERTIEPALPAGTAMADAYLTYILGRCSEYYGKVFVAEVDRRVVGFVSMPIFLIWSCVLPFGSVGWGGHYLRKRSATRVSSKPR
jgi:hypothetical protein